LYLTDAVSNHCAWTWHLSTQPPLGNQHHDSAGNTLPYDPARLGLLAQNAALEFANSVIIGTQIYGKLRGRMSAATGVIARGKNW
jgi:hypothetical protein